MADMSSDDVGGLDGLVVWDCDGCRLAFSGVVVLVICGAWASPLSE